ncbi:MAG: leucine-rich repeat domain-containing protein, partial [Bacteroidales bacterium]|nr:leucine-rich repeat domain-containing protein [Bacteroidales bacterium]
GLSGSYPFRNCENLTTVIFGDSVSKVPSYAFSRVYSLENVVFSNSIDTIGNSSFEETAIENLVLSNSVKYIDLWGFYKCYDLKNITFGSSFRRMESSSFVYSYNIETVTCKSMTPPSSVALYTDYSNPIVYVPCGRGYAYRNSWLNNFGTIVESDSIFILSVCSSDTTLGTVQVISDSCTSGIFQAIPKEGSRFVSWNDGNTNNPRTIVLNRDTAFVASFMQQYRVEVLSSNDTMGTVSGSGTFDVGTEITISARPLNKYKFTGWSDGNTDNPRTVVVNSDSTFTANFAPIMQYTITVSSEDENMGLATGGGVFDEQTIISIVAAARGGYRFKEWSDGDTNRIRELMVVCDSVLIAKFERNVGISNIDNLEDLDLYPNPTTGIITFNRTDIKKVEVLDAVGRTIMAVENKHIIDLSKLTKGYYTLRITTAEGVAVRKVIRK